MSATPFRPAVQCLEARDVPAFTFSLDAAGTTATVVGDNASDTLVISAVGGALSHNRMGDPGVASALDWDTTVPDTQPLAAVATSRVEINSLGGGDDALRIGDGTRSASSLLATFFLGAGGPGDDSLQINDSLETAGRIYTYTADTITSPGLNVPVLNVVNFGTLEFGITCLLGSGADIFSIQSSRHTLAVETNGGANVVRLGNPTTGLDQVLDNVFVDADGGGVTIIADDAADATADTVNVSSFNFTGTVAGLFAGTLTYDVRELTRLDVLGGSGGDTFTYASNTVTAAASLFGGLGDDQFVLVASSGVGSTPTLAFDGAQGNDRFDVIGGVIPAGLALLVRGGDDTDLLNLGTAPGGTATVTYTDAGRGTVQPAAGVVAADFSNLEGVRLDGGTGTVIFNLRAVPNPGVRLSDDGGDPFGAAEAGRSLLSGPTVTPTRFGNPTVATVVNGGAAADQFTMAAMDVTYAPTGTALQPGGTFLRGSAGPDTFTVLPEDNSLVTVDGGDPAAAPGDTLFLTDVMAPTGGAPTPSGTVGTVSYTNIEAVRFGVPGGGFAVGGATAVRVFNPDRTERATVTPFVGGFTDGVRVAGADFTGDGVPDLAVGTGPGVVARVRVLDGVSGAELFAINPFETFTGGVFVAAGDITFDGRAELVITPDENGGPRVRVFDGNGFGSLADFLGIDDANFRGGARAAVGDVNADGFADLLVSAGFGGGPRVAGFDGHDLARGGNRTKLFNDFFLFEQALRNGAYLAVGDVNGDGFADLIGGGGPGGGPRVLVLSGIDLAAGNTSGAAVLANYFAGDVNNRGGVRVAARALDADTRADIITGAGAGAGSRVTAYLGAALTTTGTPDAVASFDAFPGFTGGVFVG